MSRYELPPVEPVKLPPVPTIEDLKLPTFESLQLPDTRSPLPEHLRMGPSMHAPDTLPQPPAASHQRPFEGQRQDARSAVPRSASRASAAIVAKVSGRVATPDAEPHHVKYERVPRSLVERPSEIARKQAAIDQVYAELPPEERSYSLLMAIKDVDLFHKRETHLPSQIDAETARGLFTYADALGPEATGEALTPNAAKYAEKLAELYEKHGGKEMSHLAMSMVKAAEESLQLVGVEPSAFGKSPTWALWDIAKQAYLADHPEESSDEYATRKLNDDKSTVVDNLIDPTSDNMGQVEVDGELVTLAQLKRQEIIDRHVGWEMVRAWHMSDPHRLGNLPANDPRAQEIVGTIMHGQTNATFLDRDKTVPALSSFELARIGSSVYEHIADQSPLTYYDDKQVHFWLAQRMVMRWPRAF